MATGTPSNASIGGTSVEVLPERSGRLAYTLCNLSAVVMFMCRGSAAEVNKGTPLIPNQVYMITADPERTGSDKPIMGMSVNVIAASGAGNTLAIEEINR